MAILVLNCGSSSVKYQLFRIKLQDVLAQGIVSSIGSSTAQITHHQAGAKAETLRIEVTDHAHALDYILHKLTNPKTGILKDKKEINAVGHRVVHGGAQFARSVVINDRAKEGIRDCFKLAPLHNPHNMEGIAACDKLLPGTMQVAVFDTAFHQTIPAHAYTYGIPLELAEKHHIRRYGFHGMSHQYVAGQAAAIMDVNIDALKIITCHIGNGCSMTAINRGKSVDTSMGFTPLEGLLMGTRCGDIDPAIPLFLTRAVHMKSDEVERLLNESSGLRGISGVSNDMRLLETEADKGNKQAQLAIDVFCYRIKKYIAAYFGVLNGADAVVFTAGIGQNSPYIRKRCCTGLDALGIVIDDSLNKFAGGNAQCISSSASEVKIFSIPTNEELVIAREAKLFLDKITMNKL